MFYNWSKMENMAVWALLDGFAPITADVIYAAYVSIGITSILICHTVVRLDVRLILFIIVKYEF